MKVHENIRRFLKKNNHDKICRRGEGIYLESEIELILLDPEENYAEYNVGSLTQTKTYQVELFNINHPLKISSSCDCPYNWTDMCKHAFAALMELEDDLLELEDIYGKGFYHNGIQYTLEHLEGDANLDIPLPLHKQVPQPPPKLQATPKFDKPIHLNALKRYSDISLQDTWAFYSWDYSIKEVELKDRQLSGVIKHGRQTYRPKLSLSPDSEIICECNCVPSSNPTLCKHGYNLLAVLVEKTDSQQDALYFLRDHSEQIGEKLAEYGVSLTDDWEAKFEVEMSYPEITVTPKDPGLSKIAGFADWKSEIASYVKPDLKIREDDFRTDKPNYGILWNFSPSKLPGVYLDLLVGKRKKNGDLGAPLRTIQHLAYDLNKAQFGILDILRRASVMNNDYYGRLDSYQELDIEALQAHHQKILEVYPLLLQEEHYLCEEPVYRDTIPAGKTSRIFPQNILPKLSFEFRKSKTHYLLKPQIQIGENGYALSDFQLLSYGVLRRRDSLYFLDEASARTTMFFGEKTAYRIRQEDLGVFTDEFLIPLMDRFEVKIVGNALDIEEIEGVGAKKLYVKEVESYLVLIPAVHYQFENDLFREVYLDGGKQLVFKEAATDKILIFKRDEALEHEFQAFMEGLHPRFEPMVEHYFSLPVG